MAAPTAPVDNSTDVPIGNSYDKYASKNPIEQRLMAGFFDALDASLPMTAPTSVVEVGVGEGEVARVIRARYPAARVAGLDLPDVELAEQWRAAGLAGVFGDIVSLPFPDRSADLVLAIEVLEHVPDPDAALRELARIARRDVVVSVPREPVWRAANLARAKYARHLGNTPGHIQHWSKRGFAELVGRHVEVVAVRSPFPWTMVQGRVR